MRGRLYGCIEAGGTKFVCAVTDNHAGISAGSHIPTTTPAETLGRVIAYFNDEGLSRASARAIGIATFGPAIIDRRSPRWGQIGATPKPGWAGTDVAGALHDAFGCPIGFDTDVNGAARAEARWGAAQDCDVAVYLTIGTGIGGGAIVRGAPVHGLRHPEMGHYAPKRHPDDRAFAGVCRYHGDCMEGLASGPAIKARWGAPLNMLPAGHRAHEIIAWYLAQLCTTAMALLSPQRIILGGGVMNTPGLIERIRMAADRIGGGYFSDIGADAIIVVPGLGERSGLIGAFALAEAAG